MLQSKFLKTKYQKARPHPFNAKFCRESKVFYVLSCLVGTVGGDGSKKSAAAMCSGYLKGLQSVFTCVFPKKKLSVRAPLTTVKLLLKMQKTYFQRGIQRVFVCSLDYSYKRIK